MSDAEDATPSREMLWCAGTQDLTEVSSFFIHNCTHSCDKPAVIFPFPLFFSLVYVSVCDWNSITLSTSSCDSRETAQRYLFPFSLSSLSLSLSFVHFSPVWAQGSWSRAMLSQQRRDADGRAAQSGINVHCRALHTRGREEKHHQSKRGRSLADNEKPCSVSSTEKPEGVMEENQWEWRRTDLKEKTWQSCEFPALL